MVIEPIPPTTLKPAPVIVPCEIVTGPEPVLDNIRVCELEDPVATFPKLRLMELAARVPEEPEFEPFEPDVEPDFGVPAPVKPTQPESDRAARAATSSVKKARGACRLDVFVCEERQQEWVCAFMANRE